MFLEQFKNQVSLFPEYAAIRHNSDCLSYKMLDYKSNQLAGHLIECGLKKGSAVAICDNRSIEMVIGIMAILKAGCYYVPLDPVYPEERLCFMLSDCEAPFLLTRSSLCELFNNYTGECLFLDDLNAILEERMDLCSEVKVDQDNLVYLIYTSGSSGFPKGVKIAYYNLDNYSDWFVTSFGLKNGMQIDFSASLAFDLSITSVLVPLSCGATINICDEMVKLDPESYLEYIRTNSINYIKLTPGYFAQLLDCPEYIRKLDSLKWIITGGEAIVIKDIVNWFKINSKSKIVNEYGPTEATVGTVYYIITSENIDDLVDCIPIGRPVFNTGCHVLNPDMTPVDAGEKGELYLTGKSVSQGYLNREELTRANFFNLHTGSNTERAYRTGDIVYQLPDGNLVYAGRLDSQVKISGYRIELEEINSLIQKFSFVKHSIVLVNQNNEKNKKLAAFIVAEDKNTFSKDELRKYLSDKLPHYMVPQDYCLIENIPLTVNHKVDNKKLLSYLQDKKPVRKKRHYSRQTIDILKEFWAEILNVSVSDIGLRSNFFEMGGNSLGIIQTLTFIRKKFNCFIDIKSILLAPVLVSLADIVDRQLGADRPWQRLFSGTCHDRNSAPVSPTQTGLYLTQIKTNQLLYNTYECYDIRGNLDCEKFKRALFCIYQRQPALSIFFEEDNFVRKIKLHNLPLPLSEEDFSTIKNDDEKLCLIDQLIDSYIYTPFILSKGPLVRCLLVKVNHNHFRFLWVAHHLITDGWSSSVLHKELKKLYETAKETEVFNFLKINYLDFAHFYDEYLKDVKNEHIKYWLEKLKTAQFISTFPSDKVRNITEYYKGDEVKECISGDLSKQLVSVCRKLKITPYTYFLGILSTLLHRYNDQMSVILGAPFANRNYPGVEDIIGLFINVLPLRVDFKDNISFLDILLQVRDTLYDAQEHQELPFHEIVRVFSELIDSSSHPIFQVMCVMQSSEESILSLDNLDVEKVNYPAKTSQFDLTLEIREKQGEFNLRFEYSTGLYNKATIEKLINHFNILLTKTLLSPEVLIKDCDYLTNEEYYDQIVNWNQTSMTYNENETILDYFYKTCQRYPDNIAIDSKQKKLTYTELNLKSDIMADMFAGRGIGSEDIVGVSIEKSYLLIIAVLAILKVGAVYLPLDPDYPDERLGFMIDDSALSMLITERKYEHRFSKRKQNIFFTDEFDHSLEPCRQFNYSVSPQQLAYIIYTSGSTGEPKGVMIEHSNLLNLVLSQQRTFKISESSRILSFFSHSFDAFIYELFYPFSVGATLYLMDKKSDNLLEELDHTLEKEKINMATLPPSMLNLLIGKYYPSLEYLISAGEPCTREIVNAFSRKTKLINAYGPTETTVCATRSKPLKYNEIPVIGKPIDNIKTYVLDRYLKPKPVGVPGELYISGKGVARGYLNRPELNKERFIPNPYSADGEKMYKTGDYVKWNPEGDLVYLNRLDSQVKLRGLRIELQEIEYCLNQCKGVKKSLVIVHRNILLAFIITENKDIVLDAIADSLKEKLPNYMIPNRYCTLDKFPLTINDKYDYKALVACFERLNDNKDKRQEKSDDPIISGLLVILKSILDLRSGIHITGSFFDIGLDSLRVMLFCDKINQKFDTTLTPLDIYTYPTVRALADFLRRTGKRRTIFGVLTQRQKNKKQFLVRG